MIVKNKIIVTYRTILAVITLTAIITQAVVSKNNGFSLINYFSYFTIISNILVAYSLLTQSFRGPATLYILITGLGFTFLLGGKNDEFLDWTNFVLHYLTPTLMLLDWIINPSVKISFKKSLVWFVPLLLIFAYYLVRGSITSWYPYEFLDPNVIGHEGVGKYVIILLSGALILDAILIRIAHSLNK